MEKVKIKIVIAGRHYPLTVSAGEEEILRKAGKEINDQIKVFEEKYAVRDKQDALAMTALQMSAKFHENSQSHGTADQEIQERLASLLHQLEETVK